MLMALKDYHEHSRTLALSLVLVIPLLVAYEVGIALLHSPVGSGAGMQVRMLFDLAFGTRSALVFNGAILLGLIGAFVYLRLKSDVRLDVLPVLVLESTVYAFVLGYGVSALTSQLPLGGYVGGGTESVALRLVLSIGAGVYEEIVFRLVLMGAFYVVAMTFFPSGGAIVSPLIVLASAVIFSACHHVGMGSEPFAAYDFLYRFFFGVALGAVYIYRGLGTAVYTHAIYDILVSLQYGL